MIMSDFERHTEVVETYKGNRFEPSEVKVECEICNSDVEIDCNCYCDRCDNLESNCKCHCDDCGGYYGTHESLKTSKCEC